MSDEQLSTMAGALIGVAGIEAVVLGGSRARRTHHPGSDVDLGLYYNRERLDVAALSRVAGHYSSGSSVQINGPGGWGPWVGGGARR